MSAWGRLLIVAVAALAVGVSSTSAQSLGDVAKKEQQRRKTTKSSGKPLTNRDLGPDANRPAPPPASPTTAVAGPGGTSQPARAAEEDAEQKDPRQTEEYWRGRMETTRAELQRNEMFLDALQSRVNALSTDFVNRDDPAQRATIANDRQKALAEMQRTKELVETLKQQIADIEEEARQAGVPPGWIR
jgi:polyhydroxyalkanoate synthesis regulator phasin